MSEAFGEEVVETTKQGTIITDTETQIDTSDISEPTENIPQDPILSEDEINSLLDDILKPTEPVFEKQEESIKKEEEINTKEEGKDFITEDDINSLSEIIDDLELDVQNKQNSIDSLNKELEELKLSFTNKEQELSKNIEEYNKLEQGVIRLSEHPVIGPLVMKIAQGEEVDIPEYITKITKSEIDTIPSMDDLNLTGIKENIVSKESKVYGAMKQNY